MKSYLQIVEAKINGQFSRLLTLIPKAFIGDEMINRCLIFNVTQSFYEKQSTVDFRFQHGILLCNIQHFGILIIHFVFDRR